MCVYARENFRFYIIYSKKCDIFTYIKKYRKYMKKTLFIKFTEI